ncbi:MAG TPA: hypothetical protein VHC41_02095 [Mycobacteriales bacterium]|jgi:hypothetical protein|nr:hypothetical protein [Mycobacteriales bacterium]
MSTTATPTLPAAPVRPRIRPAGLARSEWTKLRSLRSTGWTLGALLVAVIGLGALITALTGHGYDDLSATDKATWDPTNLSLSGMIFGQIAVAVLGVLAVTGEYATGTIRSSIAAVPTRRPLALAKAVVLGGITLLLGEIVAFTSFFLGQALLAGDAPHASLGDPGVLRAVLLGGTYLMWICLIAVGLGFVLRHTAGTIALLLGLLLVLPGIMGALPDSVQHSVGRFLPDQLAGSGMAAVVPVDHAFSPWVATVILAGYAVVALGIGIRSLVNRDV